ncbi:MAG: vitamin K epoxide reductase family protein [Cyanobacteria bacterium P01_E01_bin.34]
MSALTQPSTPWLRRYSRTVMFVLSILGGMLTAYLTASKFAAQKVAMCGAGQGCDLVLGSRWATFLGVPTALIGLLGFLAILFLTATPDNVPLLKRWRWPALFAVATSMFAFEMYMVYLMVAVLRSFCPYCAVAIALTTGIWVMALIGHAWVDTVRLIVGGAAVALITILVTVGVYANQPQPPSAMAASVAHHLHQQDIKMYGASWCPHCAEQKMLFGSAFKEVPYIECSPYGGPGTPQAPICAAEDIKSYPTWIYKGERIYGIQTLKELADLTGLDLSEIPDSRELVNELVR